MFTPDGLIEDDSDALTVSNVPALRVEEVEEVEEREGMEETEERARIEKRAREIEAQMPSLVNAFVTSANAYKEWLDKYIKDFLEKNPTEKDKPTLDDINFAKFAMQDVDVRFKNEVETPYRAFLQLKNAYKELPREPEITLDLETTMLIKQADELYQRLEAENGLLFEARVTNLRLKWENQIRRELELGDPWTELPRTALPHYQSEYSKRKASERRASL